MVVCRQWCGQKHIAPYDWKDKYPYKHILLILSSSIIWNKYSTIHVICTVNTSKDTSDTPILNLHKLFNQILLSMALPILYIKFLFMFMCLSPSVILCAEILGILKITISINDITVLSYCWQRPTKSVALALPINASISLPYLWAWVLMEQGYHWHWCCCEGVPSSPLCVD